MKKEAAGIFFLIIVPAVDLIYASAVWSPDFSVYETKEGVNTDAGLQLLREWNRIAVSTHPSARQGAALAPAGGDRVLLFGGTAGTETLSQTDDTWIFDFNSGTWERIITADTPGARTGARTVYDPGTRKVLLFGGEGEPGFLSDTWFFETETMQWREIHPGVNPDARSEYGLALLENGKALLFGGHSAGGTFWDDTWVFDFESESWQKITPSLSPSMRTNMMMAGNGAGAVLLFGGEAEAGFKKGDTWIYSGSDWHIPITNAAPAPSSSGALLWNGKSRSFIMTGGEKSVSGDFVITDEIWIFSPQDEEWRNATSLLPLLPEKRINAVFASAEQSRTMLLFGGENGNEYLHDTWTLLLCSSGTWISALCDTKDSLYPVDYLKLHYTADLPGSAYLRFQVSSSTGGEETGFRGPLGKTTAYYTLDEEDIFSGEDSRRYLRLKIMLDLPSFTTFSFRLESVSVSYNHRPEKPSMYDRFLGPGENTSDTTPALYWINAFDPDNDVHIYTLEIATETFFVSPAVISGIAEDKVAGYSYSSGASLEENHYYYRIKGKDDLEESEYSEISDFYVDTTPPCKITDLT
ncbi:MAG TPA: kelch repeat-containing protein, partial [bacterium]|nr:kelch repeat-containing protein [bacterium]